MRLCGVVKRQCLKVAKCLMLSVSTTTREMKNGCTAENRFEQRPADTQSRECQGQMCSLTSVSLLLPAPES